MYSAQKGKSWILRGLGLLLLLPLLSCSGGGGGGSASGGSSPSGGGAQDLPYVSSFSAFPSAIAAGETSILSIYVSGADSLTVSPGVGTVTANNVPVQPLQTTTYTLSAVNSMGSVTRQVTVTVDAPAIILQPEDTRVIANNSGTFSVTAQGASLTYRWRKNGADIAGATGTSFTTAATTTADSGDTFSVVVRNPYGSVESRDAVLTVLPSRVTQTYYVDGANGAADDTNDGRESSPWKTVQKAADTVLPGDIVLVKAGTYDERVDVERSGAEGAEILIMSAASRTAKVLHGFAINADYVRIEGFDITHDQGGWLENGIWLAGNHVALVDNYVHAVPGAGISPSWAADGWNHILVSGNRIYGCSAGLTASGYDWLVENNDLERLIYTDGDSDYSRVFGRSITFRGNHFHGSSENEIGPAHVDGWQTFSNNGESATDVLIEYNIVEDFHQGAMLEGAGLGKITFRNNLFITKTWGGAWGLCIGGAPNAEVVAENNTFKVLYHGMGMRNDADAPGGKLSAWNNIIYNSESAYWGENVTVEGAHNLIFLEPGRTVDQADYPDDIVNQDPLFVDAAAYDFHLTAGSPARDAGMNMPEVTEDLDGKPRPQNGVWDIGAYEY
jgi:hypothetical protein